MTRSIVVCLCLSVCISTGKCNTIVSANTAYRHLQTPVDLCLSICMSLYTRMFVCRER